MPAWIKIILIVPPIAGFLFGYQAWTQSAYMGTLRMTYVDVGQGDATIIQTPYHQNILIDAGPDRSIISALGKSLDFGDRVIDLAIITHPQADHMGGMLTILKRYHVNHIITSDMPYQSTMWQELVAYIQDQQIPVSFITTEDQIQLADDLKLKFLWPDIHKIDVQTIQETNDGCVITELVFGQNKFLSTCDASSAIEKQLAQGLLLEDVDVLKVGHHGSKTATAPEFLAIVKPEVAVIMVGRDNTYGHPHSQTISALAQAGAAVYRTDEMGDIHLVSDGTNYAVSAR